MSDSSDSDAPPPPKPEQKATSSSDSESDSEPDNRASSPKENVAQDKTVSSDDSDDGYVHALESSSVHLELYYDVLCEQAMTVRQERIQMKTLHKVKRTKRILRMLRIEKMTAQRRRAPLLTRTSKFSATPVKFIKILFIM